MNQPIPHPMHQPSDRQSGFSLIELMIAIVIGLFLTLGLSQIFLSMYSTSQAQGVLFQFQNNQRQGLVALTNNTQLAGYYSSSPLASGGPNTTALPATTMATGVQFTAGAGILGTTGTGTGTAQQDTMYIQYQTSGADNVYNCQGGLATAQTTVVNTFSVNSSNQLICTVTIAGTTTTALVLANGVQNMTVLYAIDTSTGTSTPLYTSNVYMTASDVSTNGYWLDVRAVQITINFCNANVSNPASTTCNGTTPWTQTISFMAKS